MKINYYVYAYLRNEDSTTSSIGRPYYIGKSVGSTANILLIKTKEK
jgi:hypothetical protein